MKLSKETQAFIENLKKKEEVKKRQERQAVLRKRQIIKLKRERERMQKQAKTKIIWTDPIQVKKLYAPNFINFKLSYNNDFCT